MALSKESILAANDLTKELVKVPEWGGEVYVRVLTGLERDAFEAGMVDEKKTRLVNIRARLAALCCCDEQGYRLFNDSDCGALGKKSAAALDRIFEAARKLNHFSAGDIEELEKN